MYPPQEKDFDPAEFIDFDPNEFGNKKPQFNPDTASDLERLAIGLPPKPNPSFLENLWNTANAPLTDAPSRVAQSVSEWMNPNRETTGLAGIGSGFVESLGNVFSGLSSPLNLGMTAATGGSSLAAKQGLTGTSSVLSGLGRVASVPVAAHGAYEVYNAPDMAGKGLGLIEAIGGGLGMRAPTSKLSRISQAADDIPSVETGLPESFGPNAYAGPERRTSGTRTSADDSFYREYRERLAKGEDLRSPSSKKLLQQKTELDDARNNSNKVELEGKVYEILDDTPEFDPNEFSPGNKPVARFHGIQPGFEDIPDVRLYNVDASGHPLHQSTISPETALEHGIELIEPDSVVNNASGESAASVEAINRQKSMRNKGEQFVVYDRAGNKKPLIGPDAVDYEPVNGETYGVEGPNGFQVLTHKGGKVPSLDPMAQMRAAASSGKTPAPIANQAAVPPMREIPNAIKQNNKIAQVVKMMPKGPEKESRIQQALDFNRTLLTAYDLSAPGRQGLALIHRPEWWTSLDDMFKAWGSDKAYQTINESILAKPYFQQGVDAAGNKTKSLAERAGLALTDTLDNREEMFRSKIAEKLPGVRASNRAYSAFLNKLRADTFENMVKNTGAEGNDVVLKQIADFVNTATGRGSLGKFEPVAQELSHVFFAPRLMASRAKMYTQVFNPKFYSEVDPAVRKEALKSLFAVAGTGLLFGEVSRLAGAEVNNDPTNSDFRKIKIGNTRIDPFGGFQQYPIAAVRLLTGKSTSSVSGRTTDLTAGKYGQQTRGSVVSNFFKNKLAPVPSFVWSWLEGKEFDGEPFEVKKALLNRTVPLVMQDMYELLNEDPSLAPLIAPAVFGAGVQTYGR